ncbi:MAG: tryptophan synthase subunit alpha [Planctomycetes bacterium]|nr:tryptophan synthase subunit alpha [Planctomycetota bacterium]
MAHGCGRLSQDALAAGVRGLVIPDLPLEPARSADREPSNGTQHRATQVYQAGAASARRRRSGQAARETAAPHGGEHDAAPAPLPEVIDCLWRGGLQRILLAAPTTPDARLTRIGRRAQGFLYAVTVTGVTGVRDCISSETVRFLARASAVAGCPVLAGFGIADARSAARAARHCDGVIIGSALVEILRRGSARRSNDELRRFLVQVRRALRHVKGARQC